MSEHLAMSEYKLSLSRYLLKFGINLLVFPSDRAYTNMQVGDSVLLMLNKDTIYRGTIISTGFCPTGVQQLSDFEVQAYYWLPIEKRNRQGFYEILEEDFPDNDMINDPCSVLGVDITS